MSAVVEFIGDAVESVVDAVGDVVESVGDIVEDAVEFVGDTVQAVLDDPLPTLLSIAGSFVGIPPMVTNAAITAARGGDLGDVLLSAAVSAVTPTATNAISSTLSTAIGDSIINQTVSDLVVDGVSRGLVSGTVAEIKGGDFEDGFAGAFTGTLVTGGVTELTNFVKPDIVDALNDAGVSTDTANTLITAGTRAIGAGVTAEITGRGDFDTAFTNSVINSTATGVANFATNNIAGQFESIINTNNEIVGAEEGNVRDDDEIATDLANAWSNRDINAVNNLLSTNNLTAGDVQTMFDLTDDDITMLSNSGLTFYSDDADTSTTTTLTNLDDNTTFGTGAGINSTLVDEVDTTIDGEDTGDATDVISNTDTTFTSDDLSGSTSVSTVSGSDTSGTTSNTADTVSNNSTSWLNIDNQEDVSDIVSTYGGTTDVADEDVDVVDVEDDTAPVYGGLTAVSGVEEETPATGGLGAVSVAPTEVETAPITSGAADTTQTRSTNIATRDLLDSVTPNVGAFTEEGSVATDVGGGLNQLVDTGDRSGIPGFPGLALPTTATVAGALKGTLNQAIKQGITKTLRGTPTKQATKTVRRQVPKKTGVVPKTGMKTIPTRVDVASLRPVTKAATAPKKVDVKSLSPVKNISGLTALIGGKG